MIQETLQETPSQETDPEPLNLFKRDRRGLLPNVNYIFDEKGFVNWRAMIPKEFLYINATDKSKIEKKYGKKYEELDIETDKIEDKDLIILLAGIRHLSLLRGVESVEYRVVNASDTYAAVICKIKWVPSFEEQGRSIVFESMASATLNNTNLFSRSYILETAENRAFNRTVRKYLNLNIVSREEIFLSNLKEDDQPIEQNPMFNIKKILSSLMEEKKVTFDQLKVKLAKENYPGADKLTSINELTNDKAFELTERLKKLSIKNVDLYYKKVG